MSIRRVLGEYPDTWPMRGHLGTWRGLEGHSDTWALEALRHLSTEGTWVLRALRHLDTQAFEHLKYLGFLALGHSRHSDTHTWALEALYLADS